MSGPAQVRHAIILSAGLGTRLAPLTNEIPKVMLPIGDRPLLEHLVDLVSRHGVQVVHLNLFHRGEVIERHFGNGSDFGVRVEYLHLDRLIQPLQTVARIGGCLDERFFVLFGDVASRVNLGEVLNLHERTGALATLVCRETDHPDDSDLIVRDSENLVTQLLPREPGRIAPGGALGNVGTYLIEPRALDPARVGPNCDFFRDLFRPVLEGGGRLAAYFTRDFVMDIGTPERYARALKNYPTALPSLRSASPQSDRQRPA